MTSQFDKDLFMLQWELNSYFEAGSDQVRRRDIRGWLDLSPIRCSTLCGTGVEGFCYSGCRPSPVQR